MPTTPDVPKVCDPDTEIQWNHFHELGVLVDALAVQMGTPDYTPLAETHTTPYPLPNVVAADFVITFYLLPDPVEGYPLIVGKRLETEIHKHEAWIPNDDTLMTLAENGQLWFVNDEDECWCKTLFKLVREGPNHYTLETWDILDLIENQPLGCCQGIKVPQVWEHLDDTQEFIDPNRAKIWMEDTTAPARDNILGFWKDIHKCDASEDGGGDKGVALEFSEYDPGDQWMISAQRKMAGKIVWRTREQWLDVLWEKLEQITTCPNHGGALPDAVWCCPPCLDEDGITSIKARKSCPVDLADIRKTGQMMEFLNAEKGCLIDVDCSDSEDLSRHDRIWSGLPWKELTCMGDFLDCKELAGPVERIPMYCNTVNELYKLVALIPTLIAPYDIEKPCGECCDLNPCMIQTDYLGYSTYGNKTPLLMGSGYVLNGVLTHIISGTAPDGGDENYPWADVELNPITISTTPLFDNTECLEYLTEDYYAEITFDWVLGSAYDGGNVIYKLTTAEGTVEIYDNQTSPKPHVFSILPGAGVDLEIKWVRNTENGIYDYVYNYDEYALLFSYTMSCVFKKFTPP